MLFDVAGKGKGEEEIERVGRLSDARRELS